jgi:thioredoxin reductase (NADPH)
VIFMSEKIYDIAILGGGPAGLSAAIYARRSKMETILIEKGVYGGLITQTAEIENYPGGIKGESGMEFAERMGAHAESFGMDKAACEIKEVSLDGEIKELVGNAGTYKAKALIVATGNIPRQLEVPGEAEYQGRGVSYCATCDAPFFSGLEVYVVGGGNSAVEEALHLAKFARKVTIIHRRDELRADKSAQEAAFKTENIDFLLDTVVREIKGGDLLSSIVVENVRTGEVTERFADEADGTMGVFVFSGNVPQTGIFEGKLAMDGGYIITDEDMRTNIRGVYAAGDVRRKNIRQVVTAVADGAVAALMAERDGV